MRLLLDTHIALWAVIDDPKLSDAARSLITDPANEVFVSIASLWEIAIKHARMRHRTGKALIGSRVAEGHFKLSGYKILDISLSHIHALDALPPLHNDPFDRIMLAQAFETPLRLLTRDRMMLGYGDYVLPV